MARSDGGRGATAVAARHGSGAILWNPRALVYFFPSRSNHPRRGPGARLPLLDQGGEFNCRVSRKELAGCSHYGESRLAIRGARHRCLNYSENARGARVPPYFGVYCNSSLAVKILPFILTRAHSLIGWNSTNTVVS